MLVSKYIDPRDSWYGKWASQALDCTNHAGWRNKVARRIQNTWILKADKQWSALGAAHDFWFCYCYDNIAPILRCLRFLKTLLRNQSDIPAETTKATSKELWESIYNNGCEFSSQAIQYTSAPEAKDRHQEDQDLWQERLSASWFPH